MAYVTPKTNWAADNVPVASDFNRIENNTLANHDDIITEAGSRDTAIAVAVASEAANRASQDLAYSQLSKYTASIHSNSMTEGAIFDILSLYVPNIGDKIKLTGGIYNPSTGGQWIPSFCERISSVLINIYAKSIGQFLLVWTIALDDGSTENSYSLSIAW